MQRSTIHDLVQWIVDLEQENTQLKQLVNQLQVEVAQLKEKNDGKIS